MIVLGARSPRLLCQLASSRITTAWASAATWLLISLRWWFMAAVLQIGMISAAALPCDGQTAPNDGVGIEFPEYVDGTAEYPKNTVRWPFSAQFPRGSLSG